MVFAKWNESSLLFGINTLKVWIKVLARIEWCPKLKPTTILFVVPIFKLRQLCNSTSTTTEVRLLQRVKQVTECGAMGGVGMPAWCVAINI